MFDQWLKMMSAGAEFAKAGVRTGETMMAAQNVIRSRTDTIAAAMREPATADYAELGRMAPEKFAAASRATSDVMMESYKIWSLAARQWQAAATGAWGGGSAVSAMDKSTDLFTRTLGLYALALDPFHAGATRNDRRLNGKRRK